LTCGIREAQLANANPVAMNAAYVARIAASTSPRDVGRRTMRRQVPVVIREMAASIVRPGRAVRSAIRRAERLRTPAARRA
jgi:hypothetical protein